MKVYSVSPEAYKRIKNPDELVKFLGQGIGRRSASAAGIQ